MAPVVRVRSASSCRALLKNAVGVIGRKRRTGPALSILGFVWRSCRPALLKGLVRVRPQDWPGGPCSGSFGPAPCEMCCSHVRPPDARLRAPCQTGARARLLPRAAAWSPPTRAGARDRGRGVTLAHAAVLRRKSAQRARGKVKRAALAQPVVYPRSRNRCKTAARDDIWAAWRTSASQGMETLLDEATIVWADRCAAPRRPARQLSAWVPASHAGSSMTLI